MKATYAVETNIPLTELERHSVKQFLNGSRLNWAWNYSIVHTIIAIQVEKPETFYFFKLWLEQHTHRLWKDVNFTVTIDKAHRIKTKV